MQVRDMILVTAVHTFLEMACFMRLKLYSHSAQEYENEQAMHVQKLLEVAMSYAPLLETVSEQIAELDALIRYASRNYRDEWIRSCIRVPLVNRLRSLAQAATTLNYVKPTVTPAGVGTCSRVSYLISIYFFFVSHMWHPQSNISVIPLQYQYSLSHSLPGDIILDEARHPCMEVTEDVTFIPNNVRLLRGTPSQCPMSRLSLTHGIFVEIDS